MKGKEFTLIIIVLLLSFSFLPAINGNVLQIYRANNAQENCDVENCGSYDKLDIVKDDFFHYSTVDLVDGNFICYQIIDISKLINAFDGGKVIRYLKPDGVYTMFLSYNPRTNYDLNNVYSDAPEKGRPRIKEIPDRFNMDGKLNSNLYLKNKGISREPNTVKDYEDRKKSSLLNSGNIFYVGGSGSNNYTSIQAAINAASAKDTVFVYDESSPYYEHVLVDKSINLLGENKESTIIDGSKLNGSLNTVSITADEVFIEGFSIKNNLGDYYQAAIKIMGDQVSVSNCIIHNNEWVGIYLFDSSNSQLYDCEFYRNLIAIQLCYSNENKIQDCLLYNNADPITLFQSAHKNQIMNITSYENGGGIHVQHSSDNQITGCLCYDSYSGISLVYAPNTKMRNNMLNNNYKNFGIGSNIVSDFYCDIDTSNIINGKPIRYIIEQNDLVFDETIGIGFLGLISCEKILIKNLEMTNNFQGIVCANVSNSNIENCNLFDNDGHGIFFLSSSNNYIKNCFCMNNFFSGFFLIKSSNSNILYNNTISNIQTSGIWVKNSIYNHIIGHNINNCDRGISLDQSSDSYLRDNDMVNCGLLIDGNSLLDYINDVDTTNTVNGKTIYYYIDKNEITIPQNAGEVILINCNHCTISNLNLSDGTIGIELAYSSNNNISGNTLQDNNLVAIDLDFFGNNNNTIEGNVILNNGYGIDVDSSYNNTIHKNILHHNGIELSLDFSSNNIVKANDIRDSIYGIYIRNSDYNTIEYNLIQNNDFTGIYLLYSKDNDLRNNEMINCGLIVYGISPSEYFNNVDTTNTVNGKTIYYYIDKNEITIPQNAGEVILINCNYCTISNLNLSDGTIGIELAYSSNNNITENVLNNNNFAGIYLDSYSEDNSLKINIVKFNNYGIYIQLSNGNFIKKNEINNNYEAVYFYLSNNNIISENNLLNNGFGIHLNHPSNNNRIYNNNFIGNSYPAWDERTNLNNWDNGKKGNYWDDYKELYPDARRRWIKGIWNIPYDIYGGDNQDRYPSIRPFVHTKEKSINLINITLIEWMLERFLRRN